MKLKNRRDAHRLREHDQRAAHRDRFIDGREARVEWGLYMKPDPARSRAVDEINQADVYWVDWPRKRHRRDKYGITPQELHRLFPRAIIYMGRTVLAAYGDAASRDEDRSVSYGSYGNRGRGAEMGVK